LPFFLGSTGGITYLELFDFDSSGNLVMGGYTKASGYSSSIDTTNGNAIVAFMNTSSDIVWAKWMQ